MEITLYKLYGMFIYVPWWSGSSASEYYWQTKHMYQFTQFTDCTLILTWDKCSFVDSTNLKNLESRKIVERDARCCWFLDVKVKSLRNLNIKGKDIFHY